MNPSSRSARPAQIASQTVYFAYGSNLHLAQMAQRCPESRYLGRGKLHGYKWQISTRGFANIYLSDNDTVEGLCFLLSKNDERNMDRNEGVPKSYQKANMDIQIYSATADIVGRRVREVIDTISPSSNSGGVPRYLSDACEMVNTLVYINTVENEDGAPRTEYVSRINHGIADAIRLGIPPSYFERYVRRPMERVALDGMDFTGGSSTAQQQARNRPTQSTGAERRPERLQKKSNRLPDENKLRRDYSRSLGTSDDRDLDANREINPGGNPRLTDDDHKQEKVRSQSVSEKGDPVADASHHSSDEEMMDTQKDKVLEKGMEMEKGQEKEGEKAHTKTQAESEPTEINGRLSEEVKDTQGEEVMEETTEIEKGQGQEGVKECNTTQVDSDPTQTNGGLGEEDDKIC